MMWRSHATTGWIGGAGLAWVYTPVPSVRIVLGAVTAAWALWPDADHPNSKITKMLPPLTTGLSKLIRTVSKLTYLATRTEADRKVEGTHRMLTHTCGWACLTGGLTYWFCDWRGLPILLGVLAALTAWLGCVMHDMGDDATESGVPFWAPFFKIKGQRWYRVHLLPKRWRITTGTKTELHLLHWIFLPAGVLLFPGIYPIVADVTTACWTVAWPLLQQGFDALWTQVKSL
jgi:hypothetical protein